MIDSYIFYEHKDTCYYQFSYLKVFVLSVRS